MGNLCVKSYFLLNKHKCTLCQENLNRGFFWTCDCRNKYHSDCKRVDDCDNCNKKRQFVISPYYPPPIITVKS